MIRQVTWAASALCAFFPSSVVAAAVQPGLLVYVANQATNNVSVFSTDAAGR